MEAAEQIAQAERVIYEDCLAEFKPALERLAAAYEMDPDLRQDLLQEIQTALWRSLRSFRQQCSVRTWVFRVAHNTAASHVSTCMRRRFLTLDEAANLASAEQRPDHLAVDRLMILIHELRPPDKQVVLLYLEGLEAETIAETMGTTPAAISSKIYRIKALLAAQFQKGNNHERR